MKTEIQKSEERGTSDFGWLHAKFSFSFGDYYNQKRMGFGKLRVLNDDIIEPGKGFGAHSHENMEIITIPTKGELTHKDSTGAEEVITPGEIQVMSAGRGIVHSEYNHSKKNSVKLFQIWITTKEKEIEPRHDKKRFEIKKNELKIVVSGNKNDSSLYIHQDAKISLGKFEKDKEFKYNIKNGNGIFILVIRGVLEIGKEKLKERDSIEISEIDVIKGKAIKETYVMVIEVPME